METRRALLEKVLPEQLGSMLVDLPKDKALPICTGISGPTLMEVIGAVGFERGAKLVQKMDLEVLAGDLSPVSPALLIQLAEALPALTAGKLLSGLEVGTCSEVLRHCSDAQLATWLPHLTAKQMADVLNRSALPEAAGPEQAPEISAEGQVQIERFARSLEAVRDAALVSTLRELPPLVCGHLLHLLPAERRSGLLTALLASGATQFLGHITPPMAVDLLMGCDERRRSSILQSLPTEQIIALLGSMEPEVAGRNLLALPPAIGATLLEATIGSDKPGAAMDMLRELDQEQVGDAGARCFEAASAAQLGVLLSRSIGVAEAAPEGSEEKQAQKSRGSQAAASETLEPCPPIIAGILNKMAPATAAVALTEMKPQHAVQIITAMAATPAAKLLDLGAFGTEVTALAFAQMDEEAGASVLSKLSVERSAEVLANAKPAAATKLLGRIDSAQAAEKVASMPAVAVAGRLANLPASQTAAMLRQMQSDKERVAEVLAAMKSNPLSAALEELEVDQAAGLAALMEPAAAVQLLNSLKQSTAVELMRFLPARITAAALQKADKGKLTSMLNAMEAKLAVKFLLGLAGEGPFVQAEAGGAENEEGGEAGTETNSPGTLLAGLKTEQGGKVLDRIKPLMLVQQFNLAASFQPAKLAGRMVHMDPTKAAELLKVLREEKAETFMSNTVAHMSAGDCKPMLKVMDPTVSAVALAGMKPKEAARLLDDLVEFPQLKANIFDAMSGEAEEAIEAAMTKLATEKKMPQKLRVEQFCIEFSG
ncbi:hypothetical protein CYMTET_6582 [Cymbomonas tetramitiformis]|uniref:Magnesium transporter MgtE intracellular domain-containing protein n=1 Tax=Cymbomonas tetramitiformis TaxID=36881 RepID=A0AAE0LHX1_9CHLO|nr:hypothetical protein CYMTET_6582 [Cymbomonas tetramitiformis]